MPIMRRLATVLGVDIDLPVSPDRAPAASPYEARERTIALFGELRQPLARYIAGLGAAPAEIEEIVQETFLRLHRHLLSRSRSEAGAQNLQGWVFRVAQNLVRDRHRGWHARNIHSIEDRPEAALASQPGATPEERVLQLEEIRRLRSALQALPEHHRRCLHLRAEGLRYREIAEILGVSTTTVADWIRESLAQLGRARDHA